MGCLARATWSRLDFFPRPDGKETNVAALFETENEWQKTEPVSIPLPRASRNFPDVKTRNSFFSIIQHQSNSDLSVLVSRWTGPRIFFEMSKVAFFIVRFGQFPLEMV